MRRWTRKLWHYLSSGATAPRRTPVRRARLELEYLEERTVLSTANASGTLTGVAFLDSNGNHAHDPGELTMAGVKVVLTGKVTSTNAAVSVSTTTNASGAYSFNNVLPGSYSITGGPVSGLISSGSSTQTIPTFGLSGGQTLTNDIAFSGKLSPSAISMALFLTQTVGVGHTFGPVSGTPTNVNSRPDNAPTTTTAIANQTVSVNAANTNIDLAGHFTDPDLTNSQVTFNITNGTTAEKIVLDVFDAADPQTVANFFDYINAGSYNNSIFHRLSNSTGLDILQGGAVAIAPTGTTQTVTLTGATTNTTQFSLTFKNVTTGLITFTGNTTTDSQAVQAALAGLSTVGTGNVTVSEATSGVFTILFGGTLATAAQPQITAAVKTGTPGTITTKLDTGLSAIPILSPNSTGVPSEFSTSNTAGTIAMALSGSPSDPNSGTDQFFFNVGNDASSLDSQKFTVFGKIESVSTSTLNTLNSTPVTSVANGYTANFPTADFSTTPLPGYKGSSSTFPADITANSFMKINSITVNKRNEFLTYTAVSSDPSVVTPTIKNEWLSLSYGAPGTATVTVTATDRFGASVTQTVLVTVNGPRVTGVTITPNDAANVTQLTANATATDTNSPAQTVSFTYQWQQNNKDISSTTTPSAQTQTLDLTGLTVAVGDKFTVKVTPTDTTPLTGPTFTSGAETVLTASPNPITISP
jgi:cyclophilin family peptidyl-prolyl cis-trans isomerase